jgi:hypothetical protein
MCRVKSYKANYRQHSVDTGNYTMDKHNIKSKTNYGQALEEEHIKNNDRFCGLVVRVPGYRSRGPGFDFRRYQIY